MSTSSPNPSDASTSVGNHPDQPRIDYDMIFANVQQNAIAQLEALEAQERAHKKRGRKRAQDAPDDAPNDAQAPEPPENALGASSAPKRGRKKVSKDPGRAQDAPDDAPGASSVLRKVLDAPDDAQAPGPPENALGAPSAPKRGRKKASKDPGRAQDAPNDAQAPQTSEPAPGAPSAPKRGRKKASKDPSRAQDAPNDAQVPEAQEPAPKKIQDAPEDAQAPGPPENALGAPSAAKRGQKRASKDSDGAQDAPNDAQAPGPPENAPGAQNTAKRGRKRASKNLDTAQDAPDDAQAPQPPENAPGALSAPKRGRKRAQDAPDDAPKAPQAPQTPEPAPKNIQDAPVDAHAPQPAENALGAPSAPKRGRKKASKDLGGAQDAPNDAQSPQTPEPAPKKVQDAPEDAPKTPQAPTPSNPAPGAPRAPTPEEIKEELNWVNETARKSNSSPEQVEAAIREWFELTGIGAPDSGNAQESARGAQDHEAIGEGAPSAPEAPELALGAQDDPDDAREAPEDAPKVPETPENAPGAPSAEEIASELDWILETISRTNATPEQILSAVEQWIENQSSGATDAPNQEARGAQDLGTLGQGAPATECESAPIGNAPRALDPDRVVAPSSSVAAPKSYAPILPMFEMMEIYLAPAPALQLPDEGSTSPINDVEGVDPVPISPAPPSPGSILQFLLADPDTLAGDPAHPGAPDDDSGALESDGSLSDGATGGELSSSQELGYSETSSTHFGASGEQLGFSAISSESYQGSEIGRSEPLKSPEAALSRQQIRAPRVPALDDFGAPEASSETPEAPALPGANMCALGASSGALGALQPSSGTPESSAPSPKIPRALGAPEAPSTSSDSSARSGSNEQSSSALQDQEAPLPALGAPGASPGALLSPPRTPKAHALPGAHIRALGAPGAPESSPDSSAPSGSNEQSSSALQDQEAPLPNPEILRALGAPLVNRSASAPAPPTQAPPPEAHLGSRINFSAPNLISFGMPALQESPRRRERARRAHHHVFEVSEAMPERLREIIAQRRKYN